MEGRTYQVQTKPFNTGRSWILQEDTSTWIEQVQQAEKAAGGCAKLQVQWEGGTPDKGGTRAQKARPLVQSGTTMEEAKFYKRGYRTLYDRSHPDSTDRGLEEKTLRESGIINPCQRFCELEFNSCGRHKKGKWLQI